jgi:carbon storage regulator
MLVLSRKLNQSIVLDGSIEIKIVGIDGDKIRLGIEAPKECKILRSELLVTNDENKAAAKTKASSELLDFMKKKKS